MKAQTHYTPTENGYLINASPEIFNRTLYGSHINDDKASRYFTFAGDAPLFMGAETIWGEGLYGIYAKCGVLKSGLASTPGQRTRFYYSEDIDVSSRWFHNSEDITSEFKNGWMEYSLSQISPWLPDVQVNIEAYPLLPEDGFLVRYKISTNQRIVFGAGFGGITEHFARFEYKDEPRRHFCADDCKGNTIEIGKNHACIHHPNGTVVRIATSFQADFESGSAHAMSEPYVGAFLGSSPQNDNDKVVKFSAVIEPGKELDGYVIVMHNCGKSALDKWLSLENPINYIKQQIYSKYACISVNTPENPIDLTIAPTVIALDASWHKNSFQHGAFAYHAPFLGWRNWYAPTALGWGDRIETTMEAHFNQLPRGPVSEERIWVDKTPRYGDGQAQYPSHYHCIENSPGKMEYFLNPIRFGPYNMQECALDMMLYHIEWTGNFDLAKKYFDDFCLLLDWEERVLDPDNDGLYQNFLNTWISDGHSYNGGGCAQSSAYNYRANIVMSKIAEKLGRNNDIFLKRADKIKRAVNKKLWLANSGILAEFVDTIGNKMIHPAPELATAYLAIDCGIVDNFKAYTILKYTENHIKSVVTPGSDGRLSFSSNWLPKKYSTMGIFPAENAHLALAYFKLGLKKKGKKLLDGIVDCYFAGKNPGMAAHIQSAKCTSDLADLDFTDVSSTYLRLVVEGLFGIKINAVENNITISPNFPDDWNCASLTLSDISLHYNKKGTHDIFDIFCDRQEKKFVKVAMRSSDIEAVLLDGEPVDYKIESHPQNCYLIIEINKIGKIQLRVMHGTGIVPTVNVSETILSGNEMVFDVNNGEIKDFYDISESLENISIVGNKIYAKTKNIPGEHTLFIRVVKGEYDAWLASDYKTVEKDIPKEIFTSEEFEPVDITKFFNCNMTDVHTKQRYISPRPKGYSIGVYQNGRYGWEWNHRGMNLVHVDDSSLRNADGLIKTPSGIPFLTPAENENLACVSIWDNFPTSMNIPLSGTGKEIAVLFVSATNTMQTQVENVRITVTYADGGTTYVKLIYPFNIDDWLVQAVQTDNEIFYFNNYNHATVQRIKIDPSKGLKSIKFEAVANEVIMGIIGISIGK